MPKGPSPKEIYQEAIANAQHVINNSEARNRARTAARMINRTGLPAGVRPGSSKNVRAMGTLGPRSPLAAPLTPFPELPSYTGKVIGRNSEGQPRWRVGYPAMFGESAWLLEPPRVPRAGSAGSMTTAPWGCAACRANPLLCTQEQHARVCAGHPPNGPVGGTVGGGPVGGTVGGNASGLNEGGGVPELAATLGGTEAAGVVGRGSAGGSIGAAENMNNTAWTRATIQESLDELKKTICLTLDSTIIVTNATRGKLTTGKLTTGKLTGGQGFYSDKPVFLKALELSSQHCKSIDRLTPVFIVELLRRVTFLVGISRQINPEVLVYLKQLKEMAETVVGLMRKLKSLKKSGGGKRTRKHHRRGKRYTKRR
jgi:hypothetical protein